MGTVLITGGTGLVGSALSEFLLREGYRVILYSRDPVPPPAGPGLVYAHWDPALGLLDADALLEADWIIHLAGESLATGRWTPEKKRAISVSRVGGARLLLESLQGRPHHVQALISASGIAVYGDQGDRIVTEAYGPAAGFLPEVCAAWEEAAFRFGQEGIRVVVLRTPPVLTPSSPLLMPLRTLLRFGIAAVPGSGETWLSWIHLRDLVRVYADAVPDPDFAGVFNAVSPFPVTIGQLSQALARVVKGGFNVPVYVPRTVVRILGGEKGTALLTSTRASAARLLRTGFEFSFPTIGGALEDLYGRKRIETAPVSGVRK